MELRLERKWKKEKYTISNLYIDGVKICNCIEDTDRGLTQNMTEEQIRSIKVPGETAIPSGRYKVIFANSPRFGKTPYAINGMIPLLEGVKGFTAIRMHAGNTEKSTEGCLCLGKNDVVGKVTNSQYWCKKVFEKMWLAYSHNTPIWITIE